MSQSLSELSVLLFVFVAIFGLIIGSFLNVVIYRLPRMVFREWHQEARNYLAEQPERPELPKRFNLFFPCSTCTYCKQAIKPWHNIPILSFIFLCGRCACCRQRIPWRYPLVELLTALLAMAVIWRYGWQWQTWPALIFTGYLLVLSFIDMEHQFLLDDLTLGLLWLGLLVNLFGFYTMIEAAVIGAVAAYVSLWSVAKLFQLIYQREGMAYGDFKLFAALGAWLGWQMLPVVIMMACMLGIIVTCLQALLQKRSLRQAIPFGPYLAISGWLLLIFGHAWFSGYVNYDHFLLGSK